MAKAHITTPDGTTIDLEGTADEVAALVAKLGLACTAARRPDVEDAVLVSPPLKVKSAGKARSGGKGTITSLIGDMISDGAFKKPRLAGEVRKELEQAAHFFDRMTVNTALRRAVKKKELRRIKQGKNWAYVG